MANKIIKNNAIVENDWSILTKQHDGELPKGNLAIPLGLWHKYKKDIDSRQDKTGLVIMGDDDLASFPDSYSNLTFIAVHFPAFTDGRGFSIGNLLRGRHNFRGELRATGNIIRDQLYYLKRCGFDSFEFDSVIDLEGAKKSLDDFRNDYQISANQQTPLFRRRLH